MWPVMQGMKRFDARPAVLEVLKEMGLYRGTKDHAMVVPVCSRSKDIVEPLIKPQWWLNCTDMAREATQVSLSLADSFYIHWQSQPHVLKNLIMCRCVLMFTQPCSCNSTDLPCNTPHLSP